MMQDPEANFYETQKAFELYWEDREVTKGSGWKQFKRWEYFWSKRIDEEGNLPAADKNWECLPKLLQPPQPLFEWRLDEPRSIEQPGNIGTGQPNGMDVSMPSHFILRTRM
ncbi:MAG: hypothetical protein U5L09_01565 [Bacteroidales bacterium]|nr:hypothetical protein [Bacteroidales bacterium]